MPNLNSRAKPCVFNCCPMVSAASLSLKYTFLLLAAALTTDTLLMSASISAMRFKTIPCITPDAAALWSSSQPLQNVTSTDWRPQEQWTILTSHCLQKVDLGVHSIRQGTQIIPPGISSALEQRSS
mmetsp:Transcript_31925/g.46732  ORF Transcript_31925/g.46732 Transcript_31925/m.46732 type:complete len:126 (+) Transcript_31925:208-585(+)